LIAQANGVYMISKKQISGVLLAVSAASVFALTPVVASANHHHAKMIACAGVNACKGHSSCKTADNSCKGQNACKGKGVVKMSKGQCDQVGGTVAK
jgi:hypothetical protein